MMGDGHLIAFHGFVYLIFILFISFSLSESMGDRGKSSQRDLKAAERDLMWGGPRCQAPVVTIRGPGQRSVCPSPPLLT